MQRPLVINGFMATGKSTVGALVARAAECPFIELDRVIEGEAGASIETLFADRGEAAFRSLERACLTRILDEARDAAQAPVISVGGGALMARDLRLRVLDECVVVSLEGSPAELRAARHDAGSAAALGWRRSVELRVQELLDLRAAAYAEAHARISCEGATSGTGGGGGP